MVKVILYLIIRISIFAGISVLTEAKLFWSALFNRLAAVHMELQIFTSSVYSFQYSEILS